MAVADLGTGEGDDEDRVLPAPVEQVLDERHEALVGPVEVFEDEHEWALLGEPLEEASPRREQVLAIGRGSVGQPEEVEKTKLDPGALLRVLDMELEHRYDLVRRALLRLVLEDPSASAHHLGERPVGNAVTVGETAAAVPPHVSDEAVDVLLELPRQPGLADPCDAHDRDEAGARLIGARVEQVLQKAQLGRATDERCLERAATTLPPRFAITRCARNSGTGSALPFSSCAPSSP